MRVLVVDDSTLFRKVVRDALANEPGIEVVGSAADGEVALAKIKELKPDLVTLDVEMPKTDGLEVLRQLRRLPSPPSVIMVSALTRAGAEATTRALELGAFDFIVKPNLTTLDENRACLREELLPRVQVLALRRRGRELATVHRPVEPSARVAAPAAPGPKRLRERTAPPQVIAIAVSTGGPAALQQVIPLLPADLPAPVLIVQHMPPFFTRSLAEHLDKTSKLRVTEAQDGECLRPGCVYVAPGGKQMKVAAGQAIAITDDPPQRSCKPSADYLFHSLAEQYGPRVLAVVMTGMGDDGARGCQALKERGAGVIAQDQASSVVYGMPRAVVDAGLADAVCPLDELSAAIVEAFSPRGVVCR